MSDIKYPLSIRTILLSGYNRQQQAQFSTTEVRSGKLYRKKEAEYQPTIMSASFKFNQQEAMIFQSWFRNTLQMGFLPFNMVLCTEWGEVEYKCSFLTDSLLNTSKEGRIWTYSASIIIPNYGPPSWIPPDIAQYPEYFKDSGYLDVIINTQLNKVT